jgi:hypothetical protein
MTDQKRKFVNYSPVGTLKYPRLNKPDTFKGKTFYKATLVLDPANAEVQEFVDKLETHVFSNLSEGDYRPLKMNDEGMLELVVKRNADFGAPKFFVPTGEKSSEQIEKAPGLIWGGTEASVSFTSYPYDGGVSFAMAGVTIHKLVEPEKKEEAPKGKKKDVSSIFEK